MKDDATLPTLTLDSKYNPDEEQCTVLYMQNDTDRAPYELGCDQQGFFFVRSNMRLEQNTRYCAVYAHDHLYAFKEETRSPSTPHKTLKHSSFFAGAPVNAAFIIKMGSQSDSVALISESGHYLPTRQSFVLFALLRLKTVIPDVLHGLVTLYAIEKNRTQQTKTDIIEIGTLRALSPEAIRPTM